VGLVALVAPRTEELAEVITMTVHINNQEVRHTVRILLIF
jgi:hypothetical protein